MCLGGAHEKRVGVALWDRSERESERLSGLTLRESREACATESIDSMYDDDSTVD